MENEMVDTRILCKSPNVHILTRDFTILIVGISILGYRCDF